eukprot:scaffold30887_cov18-Tisochrysis_lutea.AAC.1
MGKAWQACKQERSRQQPPTLPYRPSTLDMCVYLQWSAKAVKGVSFGYILLLQHKACTSTGVMAVLVLPLMPKKRPT